MRTIGLVVRHDFGVVIRQRSFWLFTLLVPALLLALNVYYAVSDSGLDTTTADSPAGQASDLKPRPQELPAIGLVDEAGLIVDLPPDLPPGMYVRYQAAGDARRALDSGEIDQMLVVPADFLAAGEIQLFDRGFQVRLDGEDMGVAFNGPYDWTLPYLINFNLVREPHLVAALQNPTPADQVTHHPVRPAPEKDATEQALAQVVASLIPYIYYFVLIVGSGYLLRSVVAEKENRTAEVLLLSLNPRELMLGKLLAMSAVALVQLAVWAGAGLLLLDRSSALFRLAAFRFPPGFIGWALLFLILGFLLYGSVMAATGAIAPNAREGNQVVWLLILPLMPTLMFGDLFIEEPGSPLTIGLSLFPFSAPGAMVTRLAGGDVPTGQLAVSLIGLAATTYLMVLLAGRFFQAGNLLSDAPFRWQRLLTGWRTRRG